MFIVYRIRSYPCKCNIIIRDLIDLIDSEPQLTSEQADDVVGLESSQTVKGLAKVIGKDLIFKPRHGA